MTPEQQINYFMNFRIKKRLQFGQGIYICGDVQELGAWNIQNAFRLTWNEKDIWTGTWEFQQSLPSKLQYKYFISLWEGPQNDSILWEDGTHNRLIYPKFKFGDQFIDDKWNMEKISLNLMVPQNQDVYNSYSVIGNYIQLGNWKIRVPLTKRNKHLKQTLTQFDTDEDNCEDYNVYSYSFQIYRGIQKFRYYYIREASYLCEPERHPGRLFILGKQNSHHPDYFKTVYNFGILQFYEKCNFQLLIFSKITDKLFLGAYPKTVQDVQTLKAQGVNAILSIQTKDDFHRHDVSQQKLRQICSQKGIQIESCSIKDMDEQDFILKAEGALQILKRWKQLNYTIYIHCSAGIYRSPQIMILHLISSYDYQLQKAIELVKSEHPYANPNIQLIFKASEKIRSQKLIAEQNQQAYTLQVQKRFKQQNQQDFKEYTVEEQMQIFQHQ